MIVKTKNGVLENVSSVYISMKNFKFPYTDFDYMETFNFICLEIDGKLKFQTLPTRDLHYLEGVIEKFTKTLKDGVGSLQCEVYPYKKFTLAEEVFKC